MEVFGSSRLFLLLGCGCSSVMRFWFRKLGIGVDRRNRLRTPLCLLRAAEADPRAGLYKYDTYLDMAIVEVVKQATWWCEPSREAEGASAEKWAHERRCWSGSRTRVHLFCLSRLYKLRVPCE